MKKLMYQLFSKLGYRIINKKSERSLLEFPLKKYNINYNFKLLFDSKYYIQSLEEKFSTITIKNHKEGFIVGFLNLTIYVETVEEFHILNEVFVKDDYDFMTGSKSIVIDIGANVGITSLFFSSLDYVDKIYAFEPVKDTFEQAQYNLSLNSTIDKMATIKNIGLGKNNRKEVFLFDKEWKGNTGVRGVESPSYSNNNNAKEIEVTIASATVEIEKILEENTKKNIIVKMDCEGAEYEILEDLFNSGIIYKIDVLLLEWHDRGAASIEKILLDCGFDFFSKKHDAKTGMIYAFNKK
jgi:FkbM family methyltransferase